MENKDYKNYFLGLMSAEDAEALELQIISNNALEAELLQAENNLIEDYLDKNLTNEETRAFNRNFLITDDRCKRVEFISLLRTFKEIKEIQPEIDSNFFEQLKAFFQQRQNALVFASIFLILTLGIAWQFIFNVNKNITETEIVALNKQDLSNLDEFKGYRNLSLTHGNLRSSGNGNNLSAKDLTEKVLLRLALPDSSFANTEFNVKISGNGKVLQTIVQRSMTNREVRLLLPKSVLEKGEYQISLEKDGEKYNYTFAVE